LLYSQLLTFIIGLLAIILALKMTSVLELMLHSYSFMVSGMFFPVIIALFSKKPSPIAALASMFTGGSITLALIISGLALPLGLDANIFGIFFSAIAYYIVVLLGK
jgi:SSS family solute:Na+ symporter